MSDSDWTYRGDYMRDRHGVEAEWADEALQDPDALRIAPDPSSKSGRSVRTIGYSPSAGCLLTVITVTEGAVTYGINGWRSNDTDVRRYREDLP
ncbi:IS sequence [mine drainage metagenome]|uniref:IS sequence n=1 Tax=mine drainage metagenome TaxID=410659 RepID=T0ZKI8_9ZZZZ